MTKPRKYFERERVPFETTGDSMTKQSFKEECDINNILKSYQRNGIIEHVRTVQGNYGDFTSATDYHDAMNQVVLAQEMFLTLPAKVRKRFGNDPAEFLDFAQNPENEAQMREMGLLRDEYPERAKALADPSGGASGAPSDSAAEEAPTPQPPAAE